MSEPNYCGRFPTFIQVQQHCYIKHPRTVYKVADFKLSPDEWGSKHWLLHINLPVMYFSRRSNLLSFLFCFLKLHFQHVFHAFSLCQPEYLTLKINCLTLFHWPFFKALSVFKQSRIITVSVHLPWKWTKIVCCSNEPIIRHLWIHLSQNMDPDSFWWQERPTDNFFLLFRSLYF